MTTEKTYENIVRMMRAFDCETKRNYTEVVLQRPEQFAKSDLPFYAEAAQMIIDLRAKMDKTSTPAARVNAIKNIIKNAPESRPSMKGLFRNGEKWVACDGNRAIRTGTDITSVPHTEEPNFSVERFIPPILNEKLDLPTIAEVKAFIAERGYTKSNFHGKEGFCLDGYVWVNPFFLMDMLNALPGAVIYKPSTPRSAIYMQSTETGDDGILLPVRPPKAAEQSA